MLTGAFVGILRSRPRPGSVMVERLAFLAVDPVGVVPAFAAHRRSTVDAVTHVIALEIFFDRHTGVPVTIALAPAADRQIRQREIFATFQLTLTSHSDSILAKFQQDPDIGGGHQILQRGTPLEFLSRWSPVQRHEGDPLRHRVRCRPGDVVRKQLRRKLAAHGFLLVGLRRGQSWRLSEEAQTVGREVLQRRPVPAVVDALEDGHGIGAWCQFAELQTDVGHFEFLSQTDRYVDLWLSQSRHPTCRVVWIV